MAVTAEYDSDEEAVLDNGLIADRCPTWTLFNIHGDDSVDYYGTQPSCLTDLLIRNL